MPQASKVEVSPNAGNALGTTARLLADVILLEALFALSVFVTDIFTPVNGFIHHFGIILLLFPIGAYLNGIYPGYGLMPVERFRRHVQLTLVFFTMALFFAQLQFDRPVSLAPIVMTMVLVLTLMPPLQMYVLRRVSLRGWWGTPVVVVGATSSGAALIRSLQQEPILGMRPVAVVDENPINYGELMEGVPVVGPISDAARFSGHVSYVIVALPETRFEKLATIIEDLKFPHVMIIPRFQGVQSLWVEARDVNGLLGLELKKNIFSRHNLLVKKIIDVIIGIPLFLLSLPIILMCAAAIRIINGGPAFYSQEREGYSGKKIRIYKLRTMFRNSEHILERHLMENPAAREEWRKYLKLKKDPRIIPVIGNFLRKTSLDELPQFWNVVKGEMSLIGPRPFPEYHLQRFGDDFRSLRRSVPPGLSGLWQVSSRSEGDLKIQETLDTYYIRNWSIWMDLVLLGKTVWVVLSGKGAY